MKRMKLWLKILILLTAIMIPLKTIEMVKADSGWDSSYGGSSFGGSSFGGSSFGSSSSSWSSGGGSGGGSITEAGPVMLVVSSLFISIHYFVFVQLPFSIYLGKRDKKKTTKIATALVLGRLIPVIILEIFFPFVFLIDFFALFVLCFVGYPIIAAKERHNINFNNNNYSDIKEDNMRALLPNETMESLKAKLFDVFTDVQMAWMNFEYDRLKKLCGEELATTYIKQLDALKLKNGQNKMSDFDLKSIIINSIKKNKDVIEINVVLKVSFFDYVIDTTNSKVTRGSKNSKLTNTYYLTYTKGIYEKVKCPKCGGIVETNKGNICPYCRTELNITSSDYKLFAKRKI